MDRHGGLLILGIPFPEPSVPRKFGSSLFISGTVTKCNVLQPSAALDYKMLSMLGSIWAHFSCFWGGTGHARYSHPFGTHHPLRLLHWKHLLKPTETAPTRHRGAAPLP